MQFNSFIEQRLPGHARRCLGRPAADQPLPAGTTSRRCNAEANGRLILTLASGHMIVNNNLKVFFCPNFSAGGIVAWILLQKCRESEQHETARECTHHWVHIDHLTITLVFKQKAGLVVRNHLKIW